MGRCHHLRRRTREGRRYGWIGGRKDGYKGGVKGLSSRAEVREKVRGEYEAKNKRQKIALSFASPEKEFFFIYL